MNSDWSLKAFARYSPGWDDLELGLIHKHPNGHRSAFKIERVEYDPFKGEQPEFLVAPSDKTGLSPRQFLQVILDVAWEQGLRPLGYTDVENETKAIKNHLEDMRNLVFKDKYKKI